MAVGAVALNGAPPIIKAISKFLSRSSRRSWGIISVEPGLVSRDAGVVADYAADPLNHHGKVPARTPGLIVSFVEFMLAVLPLIRLLLLVTHGPHDRLAGVAGRQMVVDSTCAQYDAFKVYDGLSKEIFNQLPQDREIVRREFGEWVRARVAP